MSVLRFSKSINRLFYLTLRVLPTVILMLAASQLLYGVGVALADAVITATKTDALLVDVDNDNQADPGDTLEYTVTIQNTGSVGLSNGQFSDTIDSNTSLVPDSVKTTPIARNDGPYSTVGNVQLTVNAASGVLTNDNDPDGSGAVTLTGVSGCADVTAPFVCLGASANGGDVTLNADGSFTFNPFPGFSGTDTFTYTVQDTDGNSDPATVTISVGQVVWFINNAAGGPGDGRFTAPFNSIANFNSLAADDPGDYIFVYQGSGNYSGALTLLNNQQLIGHGVGISISPNLSIAAGSRPVLANNGAGITLGQNNTVRGLNVSNSNGTGISGSSFGTLTINNIAVNTTSGGALNLSSGVLAATFDSISSSSTANGIVLTNTTGSFAVTGSGTTNGSGGTLQAMSGVDPAGIGVRLSNSSGSLTFSMSNVNISNVTADAVRLTLLNTATATFTFDNLRVLGPTGNDGVDLAVEDNAVGNLTVKNSTFQNSGFGFGGVSLVANDDAQGAWQVLNNTFTNNGGSAIVIGSFASGDPTAVIANNNINCPGGCPGGTAEAVRIIQDGDGTLKAYADTNTINDVTVGILARARNGSGRLDLRLRNNTVTNVNASFFQEGTFIEAGTSSGTHTNTLCLNIGTGNTPPAGGNSSVGALGADGYYLRERPGTTVLVQGMANGSTPAQVKAFIEANNTGTAFINSTSGPYDGGTCTTPVQMAQLQNNSLAQANHAPATGFDLAALKSQVGKQATRLANDLVAAISIRPVYASGETVNVTLGLLDPGQQVTIIFDVTIDDPLTPPDTTQVCNQGTVTADGGISVQTDDPTVGGAADPTCTFLADETPPDTTIDTAPTDPSNDSSPTFEFSGTDNVTPAGSLTFECDLDGGGFTTCTSPHTYPSVGDGPHTFQVQAIDLAGNVDPTPASYTWTIDAAPPSVTIDQAAGQADPTSDSPIDFTAVFSEPVNGFGDSGSDVSLGGTASATTAVVTEVAPNDGTTYNVAVSGMTSSGTVSASIPADAATDTLGNGNTASTSTDNTVTFIFDNMPPDTTIDSAPSNPSNSSDATFTFSGTDDITPSGDLTFECDLDGGGFSACASPQDYSGLGSGSHTFQVRAKDAAGNVDPTPASYTWNIEISAVTSLLYNGAQVVDVGSTFQPAAKLSSSAAACVSGKQIDFSLDLDPTTGDPGPYSLGSATTNGSGQATLGAVNTAGWIESIYTIRADFAGTSGCEASFDEATLLVASPGNAATGGGWYTLPGSGRISFGFNVRKVDNKCKNNCAYKGNLLLMNNGKWRLKGTLDAYSKLANGSGAASGVGDLYWWDASLNGGLGDWALAQSDVAYTVNFFDGGGKGKGKNSGPADTFGIEIQYVPVPPQPDSLPNSAPTQLKGGDIKVQ